MKQIVFLDVEVSNEKVVDFGAIYDDNKYFHDVNERNFSQFINDAFYICGHNIISHDFKYIKDSIKQRKYLLIDTLCISPLIYPKKKYHNLLKDDKLQIDSVNNPLNDSKKAKELFLQEVAEFNNLNNSLKSILGTLLFKVKEFEGFFDYVKWNRCLFLERDIKSYFSNKICDDVKLKDLINKYPVELAYTLALVACDEKHELFAPWVHINYPNVEYVIQTLRGNNCGRCEYCRSKAKTLKIYNYTDFFEIREGLKIVGGI